MSRVTWLLVVLLGGCGDLSTDKDPQLVLDVDGDGVVSTEDCDDNDAAISPRAIEICDGKDNDCDGAIDDADDSLELSTLKEMFVDADGDGFGGAVGPKACAPTEGLTDVSGDCDDSAAAINPDGIEACDSVDNDCDGLIDMDDDSIDLETVLGLYVDADGDGYGVEGGLVLACEVSAGLSVAPGDCDDGAADIHEGAEERCDGIDNDCDGLLDDDDDSVVLSDLSTFYWDGDGDGHGNPADSIQACSLPPRYSSVADDCDDGDQFRYTGAAEICDGIDNNCDQPSYLVDEADPLFNAAILPRYYRDDDGDGFGVAAEFQDTCDPVGPVTRRAGDCDDSDFSIRPWRTELCDGIDNDCSGEIDERDAWGAEGDFRVMVEVTGSEFTRRGGMVLELPFQQYLYDKGEGRTFDPSSVRVVYQSCDDSMPVVTADVVQMVRSPLGSDPLVKEQPDGKWTLMFSYDEDGDVVTQEELTPGGSAVFGVYFDVEGSGVSTVPPYTSDLMLTGFEGDLEMSNSASTLLLAPEEGGMPINIRPSGLGWTLWDFVAAQEGNGVFVQPPSGEGEWLSIAEDEQSSMLVIHSGPAAQVVEVTGTLAHSQSGAVDYRYTFSQFVGQEGVYAQAWMATSEATWLAGLGDWRENIRPFEVSQSVNTPMTPSKGSQVYLDTDLAWIYQQSTPIGLGMGLAWYQSPSYGGSAAASQSGALLKGTDLVPNGKLASRRVPADRVLVDHAVAVILPYDGAASAPLVRDLAGVSVGLETVVREAERR